MLCDVYRGRKEGRKEDRKEGRKELSRETGQGGREGVLLKERVKMKNDSYDDWLWSSDYSSPVQLACPLNPVSCSAFH